MEKRFNIDYSRKERLGFDEVIYGASKNVDVLIELLNDYVAKDQNVLITKLQPKKAKKILKLFKTGFYDKASKVFILKKLNELNQGKKVAVISGGSSDEGVVNEAYYTLTYMGVQTKVIHDVGVAGIHRILDRIEELKSYDVLIVVAGFEGALPTVVGGLLPQPIIGVPTSVGYGAAKNGETAMHAMLTSCANGISVVNIDNGYGAAMSALRILNMNK